MVEIAISILDTSLPLPEYAIPGDAGLDLYARDDAVIKPGNARTVIPTGIALAIPVGYAGFILPRSGLAANHGITCLNAPGLIDSGYRGEIKVVLINTDPACEYMVARGDRIAQLVVMAVEQVTFKQTAAHGMPGSDRHTGGFGHTGR
ncbi:MAG: dUTP diphosphatase [Acidimicrobiales bacterium]